MLLLCAYGALIKEPLLSEHEILNVHPSLLPRWRGAAPVERAIMAGDAETGVTIMRLTAGLDSGPGLPAGERADPRPTTTTARSRPGSRRSARGCSLRAVDERPPFAEQDEAGVTYADKIVAQDRTLDPSAPADVNERVVRALSPHIGARMPLADGTFLGVRRARVGRSGLLELVEVQPAGGRPMSYEDYLRGHGAVDSGPAGGA